jgi:predicted nucleic acid-binding protein
MIVVDTNVIAYLLLPGEWTQSAEALLEYDSSWVAPPLWRSEFRNILAGYLRRGTLTYDQTLAVQLTAEEILGGNEMSVESRSVLQLVRDSRCSAYDCEFVAIAQQLEVILYTMDTTVLAAFPDTARSLQQS